ncbi:permease [Rhodobacteraceae bacterium CY05]|uniref:Permease n=2 Tax=Parasedimentitalea huanghaiensis TaxID=2682100 RepID=A0A6L6WE42_9RHOB|nr:permease [Zongyanglinia huanghaiensis]
MAQPTFLPSRNPSTTRVMPAGLLPNMPLVIWMVFATMLLAFAGGMETNTFISTFNSGFGRALGEFALVLLPSFILAAALSRREISSPGAEKAAAIGSPAAGAGMICPDTAYAALSPAAGRRKLDVAFGAYAGFKLLYPAGPLIVATGLGIARDDTATGKLMLMGIALAIPLAIAGVIWARLVVRHDGSSSANLPAPAKTKVVDRKLIQSFAPFGVLAALLGLGVWVGQTEIPIIDFLFLPKGALVAAAVLALAQTPSNARRACFDSAVRRTSSLLLVIGAASAFGAVLTTLVSVDDLVPRGSGTFAILGLFCLTVLFKLAQGSSMATFAAVAPVAAPVVVASGLDPVVAVFAICLGSFIAILPNDSYYWLVRRDALEAVTSELRVIGILTGGAVLQALLGLGILLMAMWFWL